MWVIFDLTNDYLFGILAQLNDNKLVEKWEMIVGEDAKQAFLEGEGHYWICLGLYTFYVIYGRIIVMGWWVWKWWLNYMEKLKLKGSRIEEGMLIVLILFWILAIKEDQPIGHGPPRPFLN